MKKLSIFVMAALLSLAPAISHAAPAVATTAQQTVIDGIVGGSASDREQAIKDAIAADPSIAGALIAALIANFPTQAAAHTETVVAAVIALPEASTPVAQKATILASVAESAVPAALVIPASQVDSVVQTVNAVKAALAQVAETNPVLGDAVANYTAPLVEGQELILNTPEGQETVVVSGDSLVATT